MTATTLADDQLARLCFRKIPDDVVDRDVVLAALWHLHRRAVEVGLPATRGFKGRHLGKECGLRAADYRRALQELSLEHCIHRDDAGLISLTPRGYGACREIIDVDAVLAEQQRRLAG